MGIPVEDFIGDQLDPPPTRTRTLCTAIDCPCLDCPRRRAQLFSNPQHSRSVRPTPPPFREALIMMDAAIEARRRTTLRNNLAEIAVVASATLQHHPTSSSSDEINDDGNRRADVVTTSSMTTAPGSTTSSTSNSSTQAGSSAPPQQQQTDSDMESPPYLFRHAPHQPQNVPLPPHASETSAAPGTSLSIASSTTSAPSSASLSSTSSVAVSPNSTPIPATLQSSQWPSSSGRSSPYGNILWNRRNSTGSNLSRNRDNGDAGDLVVRPGHFSSTLEEAEETLPRLRPRPPSTTPASLTGSAASSLPSPTESVAADFVSTTTAHLNASDQQVNNDSSIDDGVVEGADSSNNASAVQEWAVRMEVEGTDYYHDSDDDSALGHHHARRQRVEQELQRQRQQQHDYL
ncbi:hypothetical protein EMPS_03381 [Entomortierella parvispora]|uniref:Uncharacterized protein n=1 Tax=Entomortierella parvispora TaxID=205924 RepID=A0A9P3H6J9_9FUNG|nr:hypothetical protein EMPS_03381 [Entomortierella parvispora]